MCMGTGQGVMVRLMLVLAPVMCILSGIGVSSLLSIYMRNLELFETRKKAKRHDSSYPVKSEIASFVVVLMTLFLMTYTFHCTWVGCTAIVMATTVVGMMTVAMVL